MGVIKRSVNVNRNWRMKQIFIYKNYIINLTNSKTVIVLFTTFRKKVYGCKIFNGDYFISGFTLNL